MKRVGKIAVCLAGGLALGASLRADDVVLPGNPYAPIVARNVFGLNPPPPVSPVDANPPPKITPNGIMSIFGQLQVLFKVAGVNQPGKPTRDQSYILSEGERQDDIEVVKIDEKTGVITFNNHGETQELPLADAPSISTAADTNPNPVNGAPNNYGGNQFGGVRFRNRGGKIGG